MEVLNPGMQMPTGMMDGDEIWPTPITFLQLGVLVLDGSSSMASLESFSGMPKADAVQVAVNECVDRLGTSDMSYQFLLSCVTFDSRVEQPLSPTPLLDLDPSDLDLDLLVRHGGSTAIGDALAKAGEVVEAFINDEEDGIPRYGVIMLMSDGQSNSGQDPLAVAQRLKTQFQAVKPHGEELVIATAAYGDNADAATLSQIASGPTFHRRVESGAELRDFFFRTITRSKSDAVVAE